MAWRPLVSPLGLCLLRLASWLTFQYFETSLKRSDSFNFSPSLTSGLLSLLRLQKTTKTWIFRILTSVKTCNSCPVQWKKSNSVCTIRLPYQNVETSLKRLDFINFSPSLTSGLLSLLRLQKTTKTWIFRILTCVKACNNCPLHSKTSNLSISSQPKSPRVI